MFRTCVSGIRCPSREDPISEEGSLWGADWNRVVTQLRYRGVRVREFETVTFGMRW